MHICRNVHLICRTAVSLFQNNPCRPMVLLLLFKQSSPTQSLLDSVCLFDDRWGPPDVIRKPSDREEKTVVHDKCALFGGIFCCFCFSCCYCMLLAVSQSPLLSIINKDWFRKERTLQLPNNRLLAYRLYSGGYFPFVDQKKVSEVINCFWWRV